MVELLDLTRLFSRRGMGHDTGIDRVERGYFDYFATHANSVFVIRFQKRHYFFDAPSAKLALNIGAKNAIKTHLTLLSLSSRRIQWNQISRFINVGHTAHPKPFWEKLKKHKVQILILVHDVIPLDFPKFCRTDQIPKFRQKFQSWVHHANHIITPSEYTRERVIAHAGQPVSVHTIPLAVTKAPDCNDQPIENAYLILGTIEPRKNHLQVLQAWQERYEKDPKNTPILWIIGARGWNNDQVFQILDNAPMMGKKVFELGALSDEEMQGYFCRAKALIFPSYVEGFGLPLYEALIAQKPILASDIPAFHEILNKNEYHLCLGVDNLFWKKLDNAKASTNRDMVILNWQGHIELANQIKITDN